MARGLSVAGTSLPISDYSYQVQRNLMSEKALSIAAESKIYGGTYGVSGSFNGSYRPTIFAPSITKILGSASPIGGIGDIGSSDYFTIVMSDEFTGAWSFASCLFTLCEISLRAGEFGKISFNWVGTYGVDSPSAVTAADYTEDIPVFYNAVLTVASSGVKCTGVTIKINRPISSDDYAIGSEYTQSLTQSDSVTVEGTLTLTNKEYSVLNSVIITGDESGWNNLATAKSNTVLAGELKIVLNDPSGSGSALRTITIKNIALSDSSVSVSGRQRFEKSLNWRAQINSTDTIAFT